MLLPESIGIVKFIRLPAEYYQDAKYNITNVFQLPNNFCAL